MQRTAILLGNKFGDLGLHPAFDERLLTNDVRNSKWTRGLQLGASQLQAKSWPLDQEPHSTSVSKQAKPLTPDIP